MIQLISNSKPIFFRGDLPKGEKEIVEKTTTEIGDFLSLGIDETGPYCRALVHRDFSVNLDPKKNLGSLKHCEILPLKNPIITFAKYTFFAIFGKSIIKLKNHK